MGVPVVRPSNTPARISGVSSSLRGVVMRDWPGLRRCRSGIRSSADSCSPGGQPSTMQTLPGPWLSPAVVTRKRVPKVEPAIG